MSFTTGDPASGRTFCPGFHLWTVTFRDGNAIGVAGDNRDNAVFVARLATRLETGPYAGAYRYESVDVARVECHGDNPHAVRWGKVRGV